MLIKILFCNFAPRSLSNSTLAKKEQEEQKLIEKTNAFFSSLSAYFAKFFSFKMQDSH